MKCLQQVSLFAAHEITHLAQIARLRAHTAYSPK
jgi:hypothetical protein